MTVDFGPVRIVDTGQIEHVRQGQTSKRRTSSGTSHIHLILESPNISVWVAYLDWENGDREIFYTVKEARYLIEMWRKEYNHLRPHSSLGYRPPAPSTWIAIGEPFERVSLT